MSRLVSLKSDAELEGFGAGAVVALRSGGMVMTVRDQAKNALAPSVNVDWVTPDGIPYQATYPIAMLMRAVALEPDAGGAATEAEA